MSVEFLSEMALLKEKDIDDAVDGRGHRYGNLQSSPWTIKGKILATGLADDGFSDFVKNGREGKRFTPIKGFPKMVEQQAKAALPGNWAKVLLPNEELVSLLPKASCLMKFRLKLRTPYYSRDDLAFYPIDNPLKREWVFDVPYLAAAGVKGLLRWAWRMCWEDKENTRIKEEEILFGPRSGVLTEDNARQGLLMTYPLFWEGRIGFDVINPHDRKTGAGNIPIKYEVVKPDAETDCWIMLVNRGEQVQVLDEYLFLLHDPLVLLLESSGLSAKRSVGWGDVEIIDGQAWTNLPAPPGFNDAKSEPEENIFKNLLDENGQLKPLTDPVFTTALLAELSGQTKTWVKRRDSNNKEKAYQMIAEKWAAQQTISLGGSEAAPRQACLSIQDKDIGNLITKLRQALADLKQDQGEG